MEVDAAMEVAMAPKEAFERSKAEVSCSARTSEEDQQQWTIPAVPAVTISDSDVDSVDILRFDEPEGRASFVAGEPPPAALVARNTTAVLAAVGATLVGAAVTAAGTLQRAGIPVHSQAVAAAYRKESVLCPNVACGPAL